MNQPLFIDIIVKIVLMRVYINIRDRKLLTAESILRDAKDLIKALKRGHYRIVYEKKLRGNARPYE